MNNPLKQGLKPYCVDSVPDTVINSNNEQSIKTRIKTAIVFDNLNVLFT